MKIAKILSVATIVLLILSSCNRYEEGSNFSLISAKNRLVNTWTLTKYEINGSDQTANNPGLEVVFYKDGTFKRSFIYGFTVTDQGAWDFGAGKEYVTLTKSDGTFEAYHILQLKNKDLKVERTDNNGVVYKYTFKGK